MNTTNHAKILKAYVDKLSINDLREIMYHHESCYQEYLNGNLSSQKNADLILKVSIMNIFERMLIRDKDSITRIITEIINGDKK